MTSEPKGLYGKYRVTRADGGDVGGEMFILRPERDPHAATVAEAFPEVLTRFRGVFAVCRYFGPAIGYVDCPDAVALPIADAHVRVVLSAYAAAVEGDNPTLAGEMRAWVGS